MTDLNNSEDPKNDFRSCLNSKLKKYFPMEFSNRVSCMAMKNHCEKVKKRANPTQLFSNKDASSSKWNPRVAMRLTAVQKLK